MGYQIKIGVGGRFHSENLVAALLLRGWKVSLVTTFPKSRYKSVPPEVIETAMFLEIIFRIAQKLRVPWAGDFKMQSFGKKFARSCRGVKDLDIILAWSGFAVEAFRENEKIFKVLVRDSTHILEQCEILQKEYGELGFNFPDHQNTIRRELEEYELADKIVVLSESARQSFLKRGVSEGKLSIIRLGADLSLFSPGEKKESRKGPLQVVYFGTIGVRKGVIYLLQAAQRFSDSEIQLTCIGSIEPELKKILEGYPRVKFVPSLPHKELVRCLQNFDVFVMPSLEDGFGLVIPQAMAVGLVPIVSRAAGGSEIITHGKNGFLVPPKDSKSIEKHLRELLTQPHLIDEMRAHIQKDKLPFSWDNYGKEWDALLSAYLLSVSRHALQ